MKLSDHPEYPLYLGVHAADARWRDAVQAWQASGETILAPEFGLSWTYAQAEGFVHDLARLFKGYNLVLWQEFHYCRQCGGKCCALNAAQIGAWDHFALALLELRLPGLPERLPITEEQCIFLSPLGCSWPAGWRPLKCMSFYCLGAGQYDLLEASGERYAEITRRLEETVHRDLPGPLRRYTQTTGNALIDRLSNPLEFAQALHEVLEAILLGPFAARFLEDIQPGDMLLTSSGGAVEQFAEAALFQDEEIERFLVEALEMVEDQAASPSPLEGLPPNQLFADLETLEWILLGKPADRAQILEEMSLRYAGAQTCDPTGLERRMLAFIQGLQEMDR